MPTDTIHEIDSAPDRLVDTTINDTPKSTLTPCRSPRLLNTLNVPLKIPKAAFHQFLDNALETHHTCFFPKLLLPKQIEDKKPFDITDVCNGVVCPVTGETIIKYKTLAKDAVTKPVWG